ncbi:MAG: branched-chain-amino-acid transaminase [Pseudomonadota bacterium]
MNRAEYVYINGEFYQESEARISPFDHGFLYGDGVFDTVRCVNGVIFKLDQHIKRFFNSAKTLAFDIPLTFEEIKEGIIETVRKNGFLDTYVRFLATIGEGSGLGMRRTIHTEPTFVIITVPENVAAGGKSWFGESSSKGFKAIIAATRSMPPSCGPEPRTKHNNYMNHILVDNEAITAGVDIAIQLDINGFVVEGQGSNIFFVKNNLVLTPQASLGLLEGITRETVMEIARSASYEVREALMTPFDIFTADELFTTSTAGGIHAIVEVNSRPIGNSKPGPVTVKLATLYNTMIQKGEHGTSVFD